MRRFAKLSALAAVAGLLAACSAGGTQTSIPTVQSLPAQPGQAYSANVIVADGYTMHIMPTFTGHAAPGGRAVMGHSGAGTAGNLVYGGGPVQTSPKIVLVFWGSAWTTGDPEYTRLVNFFKGVGGSSWNNTVTQYYDSSAHIANSLAVSTWMDPSSVPSHPSTSNVGAEAQKAASAVGYGGVNTNYFIAIEKGHDPSGFKRQWCAFHSSESESEGTVSFTDFPYTSDGGSSCGSNSVNSNGTYDGVTIVGGHEEAETMTDPQPSSGWVDGSGSEIGDKCAWTGLQNTSFSTGTFPTQPLWSNSANGCVQ